MKRQAISPFKQARIKLTAGYMVMFVGLIGVFTYLTLEAKQSTYVRVYQVISAPAPGSPQVKEFSDIYAEYNQRFQRRLILFDLVLIILATYASYALSGLTLKPIQKMIDEQQAFAADISHSLRTPLTTINLEIEGYKRSSKAVKPDLKLLLNSIQDELFSMSQLISGMLTLVRSESDKFQQKFINVKLDQIAENVVLRMSPLAKAKKQQLNLIKPKDEIEIRGNSDSLRQVLFILLDNAIKYSHTGGEISLTLKQSTSTVKIQVKDNGQGIKNEDRLHLFSRYYRGNSQTKGTGLGLYIAHKLITLHQGKIEVVSRINRGTTFLITLPRS